jgi:hypothetical protein
MSLVLAACLPMLVRMRQGGDGMSNSETLSWLAFERHGIVSESD